MATVPERFGPPGKLTVSATVGQWADDTISGFVAVHVTDTQGNELPGDNRVEFSLYEIVLQHAQEQLVPVPIAEVSTLGPFATHIGALPVPMYCLFVNDYTPYDPSGMDTGPQPAWAKGWVHAVPFLLVAYTPSGVGGHADAYGTALLSFLVQYWDVTSP
ncbi:hypothetical protein [Paraburkholderia mimosarum]|uniref:hypothetical protein n=1 Tax=Paraburkholderia mimosarum TaxID=312026 RepID=UPI00042A51A3|nr:hypothetical protein [Paraburkholderia mimosarum]